LIKRGRIRNNRRQQITSRKRGKRANRHEANIPQIPRPSTAIVLRRNNRTNQHIVVVVDVWDAVPLAVLKVRKRRFTVVPKSLPTRPRVEHNLLL